MLAAFLFRDGPTQQRQDKNQVHLTPLENFPVYSAFITLRLR